MFGELLELEGLLQIQHKPMHTDLAQYTDESGYDTYLAIAYWDSPEAYDSWATLEEVVEWWSHEKRLTSVYGYFREIFRPRVDRVETIYSTPDRFEGVANLAISRSDEVLEHGYWGGMRDRLAASQTDPLAGHGELAGTPGQSIGQRVCIYGHEHLAMIRSGQDWSDTEEQEREHYLNVIAPILGRGMNFLRDEGLAIGCYFNRWVTLVDKSGKALEKQFAQSLWMSLGHMERWAEFHPTHSAIFGTFMQMVQGTDEELRLRLYHEVGVFKTEEQSYEYLNCHPGTGLLRSLNSSSSHQKNPNHT